MPSTPLWTLTLSHDFRQLLRKTGCRRRSLDGDLRRIVVLAVRSKAKSITVERGMLDTLHTLGCRAGCLDSAVRFDANRFLTAVEALMRAKPDSVREEVDPTPKPAPAKQRDLF